MLSTQAIGWQGHHKAFAAVRYYANSKSAAEHNLRGWIDLCYSRNALAWLFLRAQVIQKRKNKFLADFTWLLGAVGIVTVLLALVLIYHVFISQSSNDVFTALGLYDMIIFATYLFIYIPLGAKANSELTSQHREAVRRRRERLLFDFVDLIDQEEKTMDKRKIKDRMFVLDRVLQELDARSEKDTIKVLGISLDEIYKIL